MTNVTLDDGIHSSYAANKGDYDRIFVAYPDTHGAARPARSLRSTRRLIPDKP